MTKAEKERMATLEREVRLARALSWPNYVPAIVPMPDNGKVTGFAIVAYRSIDRYDRTCVEHAATSAHSHATGSPEYVAAWLDGKGGGSQQARRLYATRRDGLMAVRNELTRKFAGILADIDAAIEAEGTVSEHAPE